MHARLMALSLCAAVLLSQPVRPALADAAADPTAPPSAEERAAAIDAAEKAADAASIAGPTDIPLADRGKLHLPADRSFVPKAEANRLMRAWGNQPDSGQLGLVVGHTGGHTWVAVVSYTNDGHIRDDDARDLDAGKLLSELRENQEDGNRDRAARGFPGLVVGDWMQAPRYDAQTKRLVWALPLWEIGKTAADATINYNTRALGREGYFSLNLLTDDSHFEAEKPEAEALLGDLDYLPGQRYQDFNASTDHVAEYGLAALIGVVALKKFGLIALATAFVLKFAKLGVIAVVAFGAAVKRLFFNRKPSKPLA